MVDDFILNKMLDDIKEIIGIENFDDTKIFSNKQSLFKS